MPVRPPRRTDVGALVAALAGDDKVARNSAAARLVVWGRRSLPALRTLVDDAHAPADSRSAALRIALQIDRREGLTLAAGLAAADESLPALDAVALLGETLNDALAPDLSDLALEFLTRLTLDRRTPPESRQAAIHLLDRLPDAVRRPLRDALADVSPAGGGSVESGRIGAAAQLSRWSDEDRLPAAAEPVQAAVMAGAADVPITVLLKLVAMARDRERDAEGDAAAAWAQLRDRLHESLASRGSAIALYDLREALETPTRPVTTHLLAATTTLGDQACLDAIVVRWLHASHDPWLRDQWERAFRSISVRQRLRRRSAALVRLLARHPGAGPLIATAPTSLPRTSTRQ